jgi:hypothetical protein
MSKKECIATTVVTITTLTPQVTEYSMTDALELLIAEMAQHQAHHHQCS